MLPKGGALSRLRQDYGEPGHNAFHRKASISSVLSRYFAA